ncbi:uncharacterized protein MYCFIDRAFT_178532 [Pseudocercospora fijiensis CIRAD86]|uniref:Uncharacterized protein n=1 Tax=Pseudocercospora fijiensis (strain CIRAD86) TaxID=383855 RepID=M2ZGX6_PSEFD|nr:uncharacterized protein MYCFIDRAFT_178532 [Pseudocercospora fijiensis CIRAD86]EME78389.1 hypothetical protein MYCFIDRAFT_178532 [Pseudocercospora fijiensis CIRAD86]
MSTIGAPLSSRKSVGFASIASLGELTDELKLSWVAHLSTNRKQATMSIYISCHLQGFSFSHTDSSVLIPTARNFTADHSSLSVYRRSLSRSKMPLREASTIKLYNQDTGVMENALVKEINLYSRRRSGYMYEQGYRRFRRCNANADEMVQKFRDSWMKPGVLQPLDIAYWQDVAAKAGSPWRVRQASSGRPRESVGDNIVNVRPVSRAGSVVSFALERIEESVFGWANFPLPQLMELQFSWDGEGEHAPRLVPRPSPTPSPGRGEDPSRTIHTAKTPSSTTQFPTTNPESATGSPDPRMTTSKSTMTSINLNSSTPSTFSIIPTSSTSSTPLIDPSFPPPSNTSDLVNMPQDLPSGLQNDPSHPNTSCCSEYAIYGEAFQVQRFHWNPQNLKRRIEHCGAVTGFEFGQIKGAQSCTS